MRRRITRNPGKLAQIRYGVTKGLELARADLPLGMKLGLRAVFTTQYRPLIAESFDRAFLSTTNPARPRTLQSGRTPLGAKR